MNKLITLISASSLALLSGVAQADQVIPDDLIVQGSQCLGFDCVNNENFGFDTLRLKENNTRIKAEDTSTSAGFPSTDWQITFNDSASGGANKFSVEDITSARVPFTITGGAPTNSLFVNSSGNVGLGTSTPVLDAHILSSNTPGMRFEQDGSGGFTPQTWDIAGNEANFFIRDVTGGSRLPFRIRPGAPTSSIDISAGGNVGIGTASPASRLHVSGSDGTTQLNIQETNSTQAARELLKLTNKGGSFITMNNTASGQSWYLTHENSAGTAFNINHDATGGTALRLTTAGNLTIKGTLITAGSCSVGCDLVFSKEYNLPSIEEHAEQMWKNNHLPAVGPTAENAPFNLTEKTGGILNELEKAHIYIDQLNNRLKAKDEELAMVKNQFSNLEQRLAKLESK